MTIPGRGDLSPRRKHRDRRLQLAVLAAVVVVAALAYAGYSHFSGGSSTPAVTLLPCPPSSPALLPGHAQRVVVRNATLKTGLAAQVAHDLRGRHFRIGTVGNTLFRGKGVAVVKYSTDRAQVAQVLAAQFDGATLTEVPGGHILEVDIGPRYRALVPLPRAEAAERAIVGYPSPTATAAATPTCAP